MYQIFDTYIINPSDYYLITKSNHITLNEGVNTS